MHAGLKPINMLYRKVNGVQRQKENFYSWKYEKLDCMRTTHFKRYIKMLNKDKSFLLKYYFPKLKVGVS